jgi:RNA polymerase primary sigma factor/RNA polymerase sigma factor
MHTEYQNPTLRQLRDQQVKYAPRDKKLAQVERAERLLSELAPDRTYTYEYLCYRITDFRPEASTTQKMTGDEAQHDVRLLVEDLSDAANIPWDDAGEPVHTVDDLSRMFNVST